MKLWKRQAVGDMPDEAERHGPIKAIERSISALEVTLLERTAQGRALIL